MRGRQRVLLTTLGALIAAIAVAFVSLGFWQLGRLEDRRSFNSTLTSRTDMPVADLRSVLDEPSGPYDDTAAYRRVTATGRFDTSDEVVIVGRSRNTLAGHHVVTPLIVEGGATLMVNRGWVPLDASDPPIAIAAPPEGDVTVTGVLFPSQQRGRFGPKHAPEGRIEQLHRIDIPRLQQQISTTLYPYYLLLESQQPSQPGTYPQSIELPGLEEGPHLSYALQWFAFATIAIAMYIAYVYTALRRARAGRVSQPTG